MPVIIIPAAQLKTSTWAGGTTTELCIFPKGSVYQERNFDVRVSSARVDLDQSDFTSLPGYSRYIMPLVGALELGHDGHDGAKLVPYQVHRFEGAWKTSSEGQCTDFNLMVGHGWAGEMRAVAYDEHCECAVSQLLCAYVLAPCVLRIAEDTVQRSPVMPGDVIAIYPSSNAYSFILEPVGEVILGESDVPAVMARAWVGG